MQVSVNLQQIACLIDTGFFVLVTANSVRFVRIMFSLDGPIIFANMYILYNIFIDLKKVLLYNFS